MKKELEVYYKAIEDLTKVFCEKYFKDVYKYNIEDWVDIGGVICINDYWFSLNDIEISIKYNATKKELFDFYDYNLDKNLKIENVMSFENYLKYFRGLSFKEIDNFLKKKR